MAEHVTPGRRPARSSGSCPGPGGMRVPGRVYADAGMMDALRQGDQSLTQVANVAHLPGIVGYSLAMPDIHWGYGFPIGGVAAFDAEDGVISPGGVGYDINCGVRLLATDLARRRRRPTAEDARRPALPRRARRAWARTAPSRRLDRAGLGEAAGRRAPAGRCARGLRPPGGPGAHRGRRAPCRAPTRPASASAPTSAGATRSARWAPATTSWRCRWWTRSSTGEAAEAFGLFEGQITVMIHCGSRGFGHQVCDDYLEVMAEASRRVRHRAARPAAGLRAGRPPRRAGATSPPWPAPPTTPGPTAR